MSYPHVVSACLICDRLSMGEQGEFLHGEYIGVSHNQEVWTLGSPSLAGRGQGADRFGKLETWRDGE